MLNKIDELLRDAQTQIASAANADAIYEVKVKFLGKQGSLSHLLKDLAHLSPEEKKTVGKKANEAKAQLESAVELRTQQLKSAELDARLTTEKIDVSLPASIEGIGHVHPIPKVTKEICDIFARLGFAVRTGPHIEKDQYNFDCLNMPGDHPARDLQDTFYIEPNWILRTHTSPVQIRTMLMEKPPLRIISPGGVYRSDSDTSHSPHFHQIEGFWIDKNISMADLKGVLSYFTQEFFGPEIQVRLRPSYFPFVEPGAEVDASCPLCKGSGCHMCKYTGWIEIGGCGMVHPDVFKSVGVDYPTYNGFAFGMGVERMAVVKYGISHIGLLYENDLRFLETFKI